MVIEGISEAIAELRDMEARAKDASPIMDEIGKGAAEEERQHFAAELSEGSSMRPLSEKYAKRKSKRYPGKTILRATDEGYASITSNSGATFAEAGPTDEKMIYHAGPAARSKMPLRDPFYVTDAFVEDAAESLADFIGPRA